MLSPDQDLARWLRRSLPRGEPPQLILVANKAETREAHKSERYFACMFAGGVLSWAQA